jgi:hypothetical protein
MLPPMMTGPLEAAKTVGSASPAASASRIRRYDGQVRRLGKPCDAPRPSSLNVATFDWDVSYAWLARG